MNVDITAGNRATRRAQQEAAAVADRQQSVTAPSPCLPPRQWPLESPSHRPRSQPQPSRYHRRRGTGGISAGGGGQSGVTTQPTPPPAATAPAQPEPIYWVEPPPQYQNITYQPLANFDYNTNTYTGQSTNYDATPIDYSQLHLPSPTPIIAPIIAPRDTLRFGTFHIAQPNWVTDADLEEPTTRPLSSSRWSRRSGIRPVFPWTRQAVSPQRRSPALPGIDRWLSARSTVRDGRCVDRRHHRRQYRHGLG
ncbi:hypothetical protein GCM10020255_008520 [Rhodococcus baikonurensis]